MSFYLICSVVPDLNFLCLLIGSPQKCTNFLFFAAVVNSVEKTNDRLSVPVTKAEFSVMRTALSVSFTVSICYLSMLAEP